MRRLDRWSVSGVLASQRTTALRGRLVPHSCSRITQLVQFNGYLYAAAAPADVIGDVIGDAVGRCELRNVIDDNNAIVTK